ncbi:MAG: hypothetical protein AUJ49_07775 [Desulfovibrionaceae bacterium CG1_02_65_16]|nr:MAG: hypothetical protein AUJ49_07775 [Desulfovibrionaceae bacterium CG1_02_65_16]
MGLATAHRLLRAGVRAHVYEADDRPGGMSASFDFDGLALERYYHFINLPDEQLFALLRELGLEDKLRWSATRMGFFRLDTAGIPRLRRWGNPVALLRFPDVSLVTRLRYGLHAFSCKFLKDLTPLDDVAADDWFRRWEGREGYDVLWRFLFEKKFFHLSTPLSAAWIASRIRRVANSRSSLMEERLGYLEGGTSVLIDALARGIEGLGGTLRLNAPVRRVAARPGGGVSLQVGGETLDYDAAISTIPLPYVPALAPDLPKAYAERVRRVRNVGCACALFRFDRPLTDNFWLNVDLPGFDAPGVIEYSNLRATREWGGDGIVYVPFYMPHDHPNWTRPDAELLDMARAALVRINPAARERHARVFRYEYAQPVCPPGFRHVLPPYETGLPGFFAADTTHSFPEDRSINESVRIGGELALLAGAQQ